VTDKRYRTKATGVPPVKVARRRRRNNFPGTLFKHKEVYTLREAKAE